MTRALDACCPRSIAAAMLALVVAVSGGCSGDEGGSADAGPTASDGVETTLALSDEAPPGLGPDEPVNITFEPVDIPETDFSGAAAEAEPNDDDETATPMVASGDAASGNVQFTATGRVPERDTDYFSFTVEGEPQLYLIEVEGAGVDRMSLFDVAGLVRRGLEPGGGQGGRLTIANIHLAPGDYRVVVESFRGAEASDYTLRVVPLGPVDPHVEREPNDDASVAERLDFGVVRRGLLYEADDTDYYRFSLAGEDLVRIRLDVPPEITPFLALEDGFPVGSAQNQGAQPGMPVEYTALLHPGEYTIRVQSRGGVSQAPYALRLTRLNRYDTPIDLEPNDGASQARAVPGDGRIAGHVGDFGDSDWYALPALSSDTDFTMRTLPLDESAGARRGGNTYVWTGGGTSLRLSWSRADSVWTGRLPGGEPLFLELRGAGAYALQLDFEPEPGPDARAGSTARLEGLAIEVPTGPLQLAAFWNQWQRVPVPVTVRNDSDEARSLRLATTSTHRKWTLDLPSAEVTVEPGGRATLEAHVNVAPDAPDGVSVQLALQASDPSGRSSFTSLPAYAACSAEPLEPGGRFTVPEPLLGGLNVAWSALGAEVVEVPPGSAAYLQPDLIDGVTRADAAWYVNARAFPIDVTVELAGDAPVPVVGVILNPHGELRSESLVRRFEVHLSPDGREYSRALVGEMGTDRVPQPFVLPAPVEARFARLRILSSWNPGRPDRGQAGLGELQVIAAPDARPLGTAGLNLADPALGGYVARSSPTFSRYGEAEMMLTEAAEGPTMRVDPFNPTEWVVGFHHNRAAQIRELQWVDGTDERLARLETLQVSVSRTSPTGPWEPLGTWTLDRSTGQPSSFALTEPVWARFVRFVSTDAVGSRTGGWQAPETLRILERAPDETYRTILAEWGHYERLGIYEYLASAAEAVNSPPPAAGNDRRDRALGLRPGASHRDRVERGGKVAWYRYDVPAGDNRLRFELRGTPAVDVAAALEDERGEPVTLEAMEMEGGVALEAEVSGGETYWLQVAEPVRRVVVAWDNSGSVRGFSPTIYRALSDFTRRLRPGAEYVKLLPFRPGGFLLPEWSDQSLPLVKALQAYSRMDDDSDAEKYLLAASRTLAEEEGSRAVILIADAETFSYRLTGDLWKSLESVRPRVFSLELHRGDGAPYHQDLMQSWSTVGAGHYAYFANDSDLDEAFDRAFCLLRRPVRYAIEASSRYEAPPPPGRLAVELEGVLASNAVELILDASGSMLQRIGGKRRIDIARDVLTELVSETLPEGVPLALRVFGHRTPDACDTDLEIPLRPLDRRAVAEVIRGTEAMNLARTPIGESLRLVADDLARAEGQRLVVLITDGEETCDGDPAASIQGLKESGFDVRVSIVGFAIDDAALKAEFEAWANLGGGLYFDASSEEELGQALEEALRPKFQVLGPSGDVVAEGTAGGAPVALPVGTYTVNVLSNPVEVFTDVEIVSEQERRLSVGGGS